MIANILFVTLFVFLFYKYRKKYHDNILSGTLFIMYSSTSIASIIFSYYYEPQLVEVFPIIYLTIALLLWIMPFNGINTDKLSIIKITNSSSRFYINSYIIVSLFATIFFIYYTLTRFTSIDLMYARDDVSMYGSGMPRSIFTTIFSVISPLYFVNLIYFFLALKENRNKWIVGLILFSSFMYPFQILCFFGRDGVMYWVINFVILYILFKNQLQRKQQILVRYSTILISIVFIAIFISITVVRFSVTQSLNAHTYGSLGSIVDYLGQQPRNFTQSFNSDVRTNGSIFDGTIKILRQEFGLKEIKDDTELKLSQAGLISQYRVFGYFIKELIFGYGKILTVIISAIFAYIIYSIRQKLFIRGWQLDFIILIMIYQIPLNGVFYYRQSVGGQDFSYVLLSLIYILKIFIINSLKMQKGRNTSENIINT